MKVIYQLHGEGEATELRPQTYEVEVVLQRLIADHPAVLTGELDSDDLGWVLVGHELGIPASDAGFDRFAVDLVFVDSEGIPTFVEVKRANNRELRRTVVAQLLDYAANATVFWPTERLREKLEASHDDPSTVLARQFGSEDTPFDEDRYWEKVDTNLRAGKVRLVIAADEIPERLQRIIGFLNSQLSRAQVLGIEVNQYRGGDIVALVPVVYGQSLEADQAKSVNLTFSERIAAAPGEVRRSFEAMEQWAIEQGLPTKATSNQFKVYQSRNRWSFILLVREEAVELHLGAVRRAGMDEEADAFRERVAGVIGSPMSSQSPRIPCPWVDDHFQDFITQVVEPYWSLREQAEREAATVSEVGVQVPSPKERAGSPGSDVES